MTPDKLIFSNKFVFELATNIFVNVPVILKYEDIDLISITKESTTEYTTKIPIYHSDGTHLADAVGSRLFKTPEGEKTGLKIDKHPGLWVATLEGETLFEIRQQSPDFFKTTAELHTNDGYFIKCSDTPIPGLIDTSGNELKLGGNIFMSGNRFEGLRTGIWLRKNGGFSIG